MAEPFKLSLVGKFCFGHPPTEAIRSFFVSVGSKGNSKISLLDDRHVLLIKLAIEEDYFCVLSETNFVMLMAKVCGIFNWSTDFRC